MVPSRGDLVGVSHPFPIQRLSASLMDAAILWETARVKVVGSGEKETYFLPPARALHFLLHWAPKVM